MSRARFAPIVRGLPTGPCFSEVLCTPFSRPCLVALLILGAKIFRTDTKLGTLSKVDWCGGATCSSVVLTCITAVLLPVKRVEIL